MAGEALERILMLDVALVQRAEMSQGTDPGVISPEERDRETLMVEKDLDTLTDPLLKVHQSDHCWALPQVCLLKALSLALISGDHLKILMNGILAGMTGQDTTLEPAQTWTMMTEVLPETLMTVALPKIAGVHPETLIAGAHLKSLIVGVRLMTLTIDEGPVTLMKGDPLWNLMRGVLRNMIHGVHLEGHPEVHPGGLPEAHPEAHPE